MFCPTCGNNLGDAHFCPKCGNSTAAIAASAHALAKAAAPKRMHPALLVTIIVASVIGVWIFLSIVDSPSGTTPATAPAAAPSKIGDTVAVGYWTYRVVHAEWRNGFRVGESVERPDAMFLVVELTVQNNDNTASTLPPIKLVDAEKREYDESAKSIYVERNLMWKTLNPTVESRGFVIFDVPEGNYKLEVSGGYHSGQSTLIELHN